MRTDVHPQRTEYVECSYKPDIQAVVSGRLNNTVPGQVPDRGNRVHLSIGYHEKDLPVAVPTGSRNGGSIPERERTGEPAFPLRRVDLGGVGILPDTSGWGGNYSHNQQVFQDVILAHQPFLDPAAFGREMVKLEQ